jgi:hypothetical protein
MIAGPTGAIAIVITVIGASVAGSAVIGMTDGGMTVVIIIVATAASYSKFGHNSTLSAIKAPHLPAST